MAATTKENASAAIDDGKPTHFSLGSAMGHKHENIEVNEGNRQQFDESRMSTEHGWQQENAPLSHSESSPIRHEHQPYQQAFQQQNDSAYPQSQKQPPYQQLYEELEQAKNNYDLLYAHWQREQHHRYNAEQMVQSLKEDITTMQQQHREALEAQRAESKNSVYQATTSSDVTKREQALKEKVQQLEAQLKNVKQQNVGSPYPKGNKFHQDFLLGAASLVVSGNSKSQPNSRSTTPQPARRPKQKHRRHDSASSSGNASMFVSVANAISASSSGDDTTITNADDILEIDDFRERYSALAMQVKLAKEEIHQRDISIQTLQRKNKRLEEKEAIAQAELQAFLGEEDTAADDNGSTKSSQKRYIEELEQENDDLMGKVMRHEHELKLKSDRMKDMEQQMDELNDQISKRIVDLNHLKEEHVNERKKWMQEKSSTNTAIEKERQLERQRLTHETKRMEQQLQEAQNQLRSCRDQITILQKANEAMEDQMSVLGVERDLIGKLKDERQSLLAQTKELEQELKDAYKTQEDLREELHKTQEDLLKAKAEFTRRSHQEATATTVAQVTDDEIEIIHHQSTTDDNDKEEEPDENAAHAVDDASGAGASCGSRCADCKSYETKVLRLMERKAELKDTINAKEKEISSLKQRLLTQEHNEQILKVQHGEAMKTLEQRLAVQEQKEKKLKHQHKDLLDALEQEKKRHSELKQSKEKDVTNLRRQLEEQKDKEQSIRSMKTEEVQSLENEKNRLEEKHVELECEIELLEREKSELEQKIKQKVQSHSTEVYTLQEENLELQNQFTRLQDALDEELAKECKECNKKVEQIKEWQEKYSQVSYRLKKLQESFPKSFEDVSANAKATSCNKCENLRSQMDIIRKERQESQDRCESLARSLEELKGKSCDNCSLLSKRIEYLKKDREDGTNKINTLENKIHEMQQEFDRYSCPQCKVHSQDIQKLEEENTSLLNQVERFKQESSQMSRKITEMSSTACLDCVKYKETLQRLEQKYFLLQEQHTEVKNQLSKQTQIEALELIRQSLQQEVSSGKGLLSEQQRQVLQKGEEEIRSRSASEQSTPSLFRAKERELDRIQAELEIREQAMASLEEKNAMLEKSLREANQLTRQLETQVKETTLSLKDTKETLLEREGTISKLESTKRELEVELRYTKKELEATSEQLQSLKQAHTSLTKEAVELRKEAEVCKKLRVECDELNIDLDVADRRIETLDTELKDVKKRTSSEIQEQSASLHKLAKRNNMLYQDIDNKTKTIAHLEATIATYKSTHEFQRVEGGFTSSPQQQQQHISQQHQIHNRQNSKDKFVSPEIMMQQAQQSQHKNMYAQKKKPYRQLPMVLTKTSNATPTATKQSRNEKPSTEYKKKNRISRSKSPFIRGHSGRRESAVPVTPNVGTGATPDGFATFDTSKMVDNGSRRHSQRKNNNDNAHHVVPSHIEVDPDEYTMMDASTLDLGGATTAGSPMRNIDRLWAQEEEKLGSPFLEYHPSTNSGKASYVVF